MIKFGGDKLDITEINSLLGQVDLQNIFDKMFNKQEISISVVVKPSTPTSSAYNVYDRMTGEWLCIGGSLDCLLRIGSEYGIK